MHRIEHLVVYNMNIRYCNSCEIEIKYPYYRNGITCKTTYAQGVQGGTLHFCKECWTKLLKKGKENGTR